MLIIKEDDLGDFEINLKLIKDLCHIYHFICNENRKKIPISIVDF